MKILSMFLKLFILISILLPLNSYASESDCVLLVYHRFSDDEPKSTSTSPDLFKNLLLFECSSFTHAQPSFILSSRYKILTFHTISRPSEGVICSLPRSAKFPTWNFFFLGCGFIHPFIRSKSCLVDAEIA